MMTMWNIVIFLAGVFFWNVTVSANSDEIKSLPGLKDKINFKQYSGYLNASDGKFLHYWFVESQRSPNSDPLVLWMNGGPCCSSLFGLLYELGPFRIKSDGETLYINDFSWNKVANVIFLEAPAGVGFSYSKSGHNHTNDNITAEDNYLALQHFFEKFPHFKKNEFYVTGESYGGVYVPTLSVVILKGKADINFKGFAIGNGLLDDDMDQKSILFFFFNHGVIDQVTWSSIAKYCCKGCATRDSCEFDSKDPKCQDAVKTAYKVIYDANLNWYNIYDNCCNISTLSSPSRDEVDKKYLGWLSSAMNDFIQRTFDDDPIANYLNQKSVRHALHIPDNVQKWEECADVNYTSLYSTMKPQIMELLNSGKLRGLIYNGDVDAVCCYLSDEWFTEDLGLKVLKEYRAWKCEGQAAGFVKEFEKLSFLTIKGAGHMVPADKPAQAFKMISSFLSNEPY